ncbi:carboxypeptidase-like regulatory domain-containing protein [Hymenobacter algoricola]|uniref:Carboxypeptidase-like regulatory domain-containing protein n=1 Tax=Hymenobacter algoricola TaxID=486267 RepID=A0ABP7N1N4_9BACT
MTFRSYFLLLLLLAGSRGLRAQQRLTGKITDAATGQPVAYASVVVAASSQGTTSNAEGEFELPALRLPARLIVSALTHVRDTVAVAAGGPLSIRLLPATVLLPDVTTGSYTAELLKKAYRQLHRSYPQKTYAHAFYRQITRLDGAATEVQEMIWDAKTSSAGVEGTALAQARYAEKEALVNFKNFSFFTKAYSLYDTKADSSASTAVVSLNTARNYTLSVLGVTQDGPRQLVEIGFVSKPDVNPHNYRGRLTIDEASGQILRFQLTTPDSRSRSNNPMFKLQNPATTFELVFEFNPTGAARLSYVHIGYQTALTRPFRDAVQVQTSSFTYFYDGQTTPASATYAPASATQADLATIKKTTYNAAQWQNNPAVKRTPLEEEVIRSFEQKGAFGTLLSH